MSDLVKILPGENTNKNALNLLRLININSKKNSRKTNFKS